MFLGDFVGAGSIWGVHDDFDVIHSFLRDAHAHHYRESVRADTEYIFPCDHYMFTQSDNY